MTFSPWSGDFQPLARRACKLGWVSAYAPPLRPPARVGLLTTSTLALTASLSGLVVLGASWGPDWPAQEYRAWLAAHVGVTVWTNGWYSGQPLTGYSVLYPLLGMLLGASLTGLLAAIGAGWGAALLAPRSSGWRRRLFVAGVASVLALDLMIGQIPYLVGVSFAVWAVWATLRNKPRRAALFAVGCSLSSPLAGAFLLLAALALGARLGWKRSRWLAGSMVGIAVSAVVGGGAGTYPFRLRGLLAIGIFVVFCFALSDRGNRALRTFAAFYGIAAIALFIVPNPIGGNISRLGQLVALPLACHFIVGGRGLRRWLCIAAVPLAISWPVVPALGSVLHGANDPSRREVYYTGVASMDVVFDLRPIWRGGQM